MKILQIAPHLLPVPPTLGGAVEDGIYRLALLQTKNHEVHIISRTGKINEISEIQYKHVNFSCFEKIILSYFYTFRNHISSKLRSLLKYSYAYKIRSQLNEPYDLIHIRNLAIAYPYIAKLKRDAKVILHLHNDVLKKNKLKKVFYRFFINKYDLILFVSEHLKQKTLYYFPELISKSIVLHNGVDLNIFSLLDNSINYKIRKHYKLTNEKILLYAGRLIDSKGVIYLIEAFNEIVKTHFNVKLIIAGNREFKLSKDDKYVKLIKKKANKNVIFTGFLPHSELRKLYSVADIFIYPPIWDEPFGKSVLEAMAARTAIIATRSGGIPEIISSPDQGFIVEKFDITGIVNIVSRLLNNEKLLESYKKAAWQRSKNFSWDIVNKNLNDIYSKIMRDN